MKPKTKEEQVAIFFAALPSGNPNTAKAGKNFFMREADTALRQELGEQIDDGNIDPSDDKWHSRVQMRALEMIQDLGEIIPAVAFAVRGEIEKQASYSYLGYESFEEWQADSRLKRGGVHAQHKTWFDTIIPKIIQTKAMTQGKIVEFCLTAVNDRGHYSISSGPSRHAAMRMATPDLRLLCEDHTKRVTALRASKLSPEKKAKKIDKLNDDMKFILQGYLAIIADNKIENKEKEVLFDKLGEGYRPTKAIFNSFSLNGQTTIVGRFNKEQFKMIETALKRKVLFADKGDTDVVGELLRLTSL